MYALKWLFALTTLVALAVTGYLYSRQCEINNSLRKRYNAGKAILNERFVKSLLADDKIVGSLDNDRDFLAGTCDYVIADVTELSGIIRKPPLTPNTTTHFPQFMPATSDRGYVYAIPEKIPPGFMEGEFLSGYVVITHDGVIIGVYPFYSGWDA